MQSVFCFLLIASRPADQSASTMGINAAGSELLQRVPQIVRFPGGKHSRLFAEKKKHFQISQKPPVVEFGRGPTSAMLSSGTRSLTSLQAADKDLGIMTTSVTVWYVAVNAALSPKAAWSWRWMEGGGRGWGGGVWGLKCES